MFEMSVSTEKQTCHATSSLNSSSGVETVGRFDRWDKGLVPQCDLANVFPCLHCS